MNILCRTLVCWVLIGLSWSAMAQLVDPTRPPAGQPGGGESAPGPEVMADGLRLQSVLLPQGGRPVAVISGKTVPLGGMLGESKLIRLTEREAILQGPEGTTHLYLTPGVSKTMVEGRSGGSGQRAGNKKGSS